MASIRIFLPRAIAVTARVVALLLRPVECDFTGFGKQIVWAGHGLVASLFWPEEEQLVPGAVWYDAESLQVACHFTIHSMPNDNASDKIGHLTKK